MWLGLVLCIVACNDWGTGIVLQVPRDSANPAEKGKNLGYTILLNYDCYFV